MHVLIYVYQVARFNVAKLLNKIQVHSTTEYICNNIAFSV